MRIASIDIGTNTVLMLIAEAESSSNFKVLRQEYDVARLGQDVDKTGIINDDAIQRTVNILNRCNKICKVYKVEKIFCSGTSALRDAKNSSNVVKTIFEATGIEIEVISGDEEAYLSFIGAIEDDKRSFLIDIGGGSTEYITGNIKELSFKKSFDIGAVRITERFFTNQPPTLSEITNAENYISTLIKQEIQENVHNIKNYYAVAGTATTIATSLNGLKDYEVDKIDGYILNYYDLTKMFELYSKSSKEDIITKYGVHHRRADLITAGALILKVSFEIMNIQELIVSSKGLRYGYLKSKLK
jgi:exopolyphosphatase/guanosine-5'-triphosphate,3'-diphosphate pyrophosphatase